jgi:hypothetical protein
MAQQQLDRRGSEAPLEQRPDGARCLYKHPFDCNGTPAQGFACMLV